MNTNKTYYADDRLNDCCAYCGDFAETEDHVPSRCFLDKPYPQNMPVVPCCSKCNHGFSFDEEYVSCFIDCMKENTAEPNIIRRKKTCDSFLHSPKLQERIASQIKEFGGLTIYDYEKNRFERVIYKLAYGHLAYENSSLNWDSEHETNMWFLETMPKTLLEEFDKPYVGGDIVPEIGSNCFSKNGGFHIYVGLSEHFCCCDWIIVQEGRYRYCVSPDSTKVKLVIAEYLAAEVSITR